MSSIRQKLRKTLRKFNAKSPRGSRAASCRTNRRMLASIEALEERRVLAAAFQVNSSVGYSFNSAAGTAGADISLSRSFTTRTLGAFDSGANGFNSNSAQVGIWNAGGGLLASGALTSSSPLSNSYRYVNLAAPLTLSAGTYYIGAYYPGNDTFPGNASVATATNVSSAGQARFSSSTAFAFPGTVFSGGNPGFFAGNFIEMLPPQLTGPASVSVNETSTATASGTYSLAGEPFTLTASSGSVTQTAIDALSGTWAWSQGTSDGPVSSTITLTATGTLSGKTQTFSFTQNVFNVAPTAVLTGPSSGALGQSVTYSLTAAIDPSLPDTGAGFRYSYSVGDPSSLAASYSTASTSNSFTFSLPDKANFTLYARIYDKDNGFTQYTKTVSVTNTSPTVISTLPSNSGYVNDSVSSIVVTFNEPVTAVSAQDIRNYRLKGPSGVIPLTSATLNGAGTAATLTFAPQTAGGSYSLNVGNVSDVAGNRMSALDGYGTASIYTAPQLSNTMGLATGDFNGDGLSDIVAAGTGLVLLPGQAGGTFGSAVSIGTTANGSNNSVEAVDLNRDGKLDLIVTEDSSGISVYLGNGNGTFGARQTRSTSGSTQNVAVIDVNNDGLLDIVTANVSGSGFTTFMNNGGSFLSWSAPFSSGMPNTSWDVHAAGDLNGDGRMDLVLTPYGTTAFVAIGTATPGVFSYTGLTFLSGYNTEHSALADLDGDGRLDLISGGSSGSINGGAITFGTTAAPFFGTTQALNASATSHAINTLAADLDADGDLDVMRATWGVRTIEISRNQGGRAFSSEIVNLPTSLSGYTWELRTTDVNSDGLPDIIGTDYSNRAVFVIRSAANPAASTFTLNHTPVDLSLSSNSVDENNPIGALIGTLSSIDPDVGDTFTYSLVTGLGSTDNGSFTISGNQLLANASFDFEAKSSLSIRVRTTDARGSTFDQVFTISVTDINEAPTAITLQNVVTTLPENTNTALAIKVADIVVTDDALGTNDLSIGGIDSAYFQIVGNELFLKAGTQLNFEDQPTYAIFVQVDDASAGTTPDASSDYALTLSNLTEVSGLDVQLGQTQRSYVRNVDILFDQANGLASLLSGGRVQVVKRDLQGNNPTLVAAPSMAVVGQSIRLDFGANGVGGNRNATAGDGYYEVGVDVDGDGTFESKLHFFRLLGDVNGDGMVNNADLLQIAGASGYSPENDVNGDGVVNTNDRTLAQRSLNRRLASGLPLDD